MKWKLTHNEFIVLHSLLQNICIGIKPAGIQATVLHGVLFRLYKRFYNKAMLAKKKYSISVEDEEACAFYMFFTSDAQLSNDPFIINLVGKINNSIHQKYSS